MPKQTSRYLRVVFSKGINPDKWFDRFDNRVPGWKAAGANSNDPLPHIANGNADIAIMRVGENGVASDTYHSVYLYQEDLGIAAPKDHPIEVMKIVKLSELDGEMEMYRTPPTGEVNVAELHEALGVVAANVGIAIGPRPLIKALRSKGIVQRELRDNISGKTNRNGEEITPKIGRTWIALVWRKDHDSDEIQDFVGICRGRRATSSRSNTKHTEKTPTVASKKKQGHNTQRGKKPKRRR